MSGDQVLVVDDAKDYLEDVRCAASTSKSFEFTICTGLIEAVNEIQNPKNNFKIAILDLFFDLENDGDNTSIATYGWILIPLIYEHHPNCLITLNSNTALEFNSLKKAHFAYKVGNVCSKQKNPVTSDFNKINIRGAYPIPEIYQNQLDKYEQKVGKKNIKEMRGLKFMDAVILELTVFGLPHEAFMVNDPDIPQFQYWNILKTGKDRPGKPTKFITVDYRKRRIIEIKKWMKEQNILNDMEAKFFQPANLMERLISENMLISFEDMALFKREAGDEEWLKAGARGLLGKRSYRTTCFETHGKSHVLLLRYIRELHANHFGEIKDGDTIPSNTEMAVELCNYFDMEY